MRRSRNDGVNLPVDNRDGQTVTTRKREVGNGRRRGRVLRRSAMTSTPSWGRAMSMAAAAAMACAVVLGARSASAYCREITAATPPSFDPATSPTGCWAGDGPPAQEVYWKNLCVGYS